MMRSAAFIRGRKSRRLLRLAGTFAAVACAFAAVSAQAAYPDRPIRMVVPFPPGGNVDVTTRTITAALSRELKQSVVIDNMGGAAGSIGAANGARAKPDGYTLTATTLLTMTANPVMIPGIQVRLSDFQPIGVLGVAPCLLEVSARNPHGIKDLPSFLAYAHASAGKMSIGHGGNGSMNQLTAVLVEREFGLHLNPIPYKGSAPVLTDLLGNQLDSATDQITSSLSQIRAGAMIPIAVTSDKRLPNLPQVPTFKELGKPNLEMATYTVLLAPKGTPQPVMETLNKALARALADPAVQSQLLNTGATVELADLSQAGAIVAREQAKLAPFMKPEILMPRK
jgi:tripartite-type tricarboxylate transporter receptor subunit TctC